MTSRLYGSDYFAAFKARLEKIALQALILFAPGDEPMMAAVRRHRDRIRSLTANEVLALVPIDIATGLRQSGASPPAVSRSAGAWALLDQFVALGGVRWDELPALVVGHSALTGPRLVVPTAPDEILPQLEVIASAARDAGRAIRLRMLRQSLSNLSLVRLAPRVVRTKTAPDVIDQVLASLAGVIAYGEPPELGVVCCLDTQDWPAREHIGADLELLPPDARERLSDPRLFATAAAVKALASPHQLPETLQAVWSQLDDACRAFLSTAVVVSNALSESHFEVDYAAAGAPLCKLFERQLNLAPVQIARRSRGVPLPEWYTVFDPNLPAGRGLVNTDTHGGQRRHVNINELDPLSPSSGHRFLTVGEAQHLLRVMEGEPALRAGLDADRVSDLRATARTIGAIRNHVVAHSRPMPRAAFERLRTLVLESGTIERLAGIAARLRV